MLRTIAEVTCAFFIVFALYLALYCCWQQIKNYRRLSKVTKKQILRILSRNALSNNTIVLIISPENVTINKDSAKTYENTVNEIDKDAKIYFIDIESFKMVVV